MMHNMETPRGAGTLHGAGSGLLVVERDTSTANATVSQATRISTRHLPPLADALGKALTMATASGLIPGNGPQGE